MLVARVMSCGSFERVGNQCRSWLIYYENQASQQLSFLMILQSHFHLHLVGSRKTGFLYGLDLHAWHSGSSFGSWNISARLQGLFPLFIFVKTTAAACFFWEGGFRLAILILEPSYCLGIVLFLRAALSYSFF